jgi:hypothetical protein
LLRISNFTSVYLNENFNRLKYQQQCWKSLYI